MSLPDAVALHKQLGCNKGRPGSDAFIVRRGPEGLSGVIKKAAIAAFPPDGRKPQELTKKQYRAAICDHLPPGVPGPSDRTFNNHGY